jgi:hypothetical protein
MSTRNDDIILPASAQAVRLYCCYAERNRREWDQLHAHLSHLVNLRVIEIRHNHDYNLLHERHNHLDTADIVLLLISHYFFASKPCWDLMCQAMKRHDAGILHVVPVWLSLVDYLGTPIEKLQMLPREEPIKRWRDRAEAYVDVVRGIRRIIELYRARGGQG